MSITLAELGEKNIIAKVIKPICNFYQKSALELDDCALIELQNEIGSNNICVSTDRTPSDLRAFEWGIMSHFQYGQYCATSNISDVAAMGGKPFGFLVNIAAPSEMFLEDLKRFFHGLLSELSNNSVKLLGGDTKSGRDFNAVGIVIGGLPNGTSLKRSNMQAGEALYISGSTEIGLIPGAFAFFQNREVFKKKINYPALLEIFTIALIQARAQVKFGLSLINCSPNSACIDNSDGILESCKELGKSSNLSVEIDVSISDVHPAVLEVANHLDLNPIALALSAGADFRLIFSLDSDLSPPFPSIKIGRAVDSKGEPSVYSLRNSSIISEATGWVHFQENE